MIEKVGSDNVLRERRSVKMKRRDGNEIIRILSPMSCTPNLL